MPQHFWQTPLVLLLIWSLHCVNSISRFGTAYYFEGLNYTSIPTAALNLDGQAPICCIRIHSGEKSCNDGFDDHIKHFGRFEATLDLSCTVYNNSTFQYERLPKVQYQVIPVAASDIPYQARILSPPFGTILNNHLKIELQTNVSQYGQYVLRIVGLPDTVLPSTMQTIESHNSDIEPGSWFYSITPLVASSDHDLYGIPSVGYMEFTPSETDIRNMRRYVNRTQSNADIPTGNTTSTTALTNQKPSMVCFFSSNTIDGLRSVWLQQSEFMDADRFSFTWLIAADVPSTPTTQPAKYSLRAALHNLSNFNKNVFIYDKAGFVLKRHDLMETPNDGSPPVEDTWVGNITNIYLYAHQRWEIANRNIDAMSPPWCKRLYEKMRHSLLESVCEVAVYGNDRHFCSNTVIIDTARSLNIPSVGELSNHFVHPLTVPDVLVAPSEFAAHHQSIQNLLQNNQIASLDSSVVLETPIATVQVVVISPSVNTDALRPLSREDKKNADVQHRVYRHPGCVVTGAAPINQSPCVVIGFLARLSKEKSPGLFLQMTHEILQHNPFARFTIIGDGPLRTHLQNLCDRLQIRWAVHFTGWASATDLPSLLSGVDIVVNPFLWPETFCIANIEVMSMGVPLVTFAVGGIGEYIQDPALFYHSIGDGSDGGLHYYHKDSQGDFEVSNNAVVVHRATPAALARATLHLIQRPALRRALGLRGRQTILDHFKVDRQMRQYAKLYDSLLMI